MSEAAAVQSGDADVMLGTTVAYPREFVSAVTTSRGARLLGPAPDCDPGPYGLDHAEGPCTLQETIKRSESTGAGECQNEPRTAIFQRIEDQHRAHSSQTEKRKSIHQGHALPSLEQAHNITAWHDLRSSDAPLALMGPPDLSISPRTNFRNARVSGAGQYRYSPASTVGPSWDRRSPSSLDKTEV